ncbi:MAG: type II CAAX endopeptidase family protein [Chloroflexota bacterium]
MITTNPLETNEIQPERPLPTLWQRRDIWQISLLFIFLYLVGNVVAALISGDNQLLLTVNILLLSALAGCGSILLINRRRQRHSWQQLGFIRFNRYWFMVGSGLILAVSVGRGLLLSWLAVRFPALTWGTDMLTEALLFEAPAAMLVSTLAAVLVVPLWEEFFFRGFIHNALRNRLGLWAAILLSSLLFGLFHIIPLQALGAFLLAIPLAWAYEKSGSLWLVIYLHALNNLIAFLLAFAIG